VDISTISKKKIRKSGEGGGKEESPFRNQLSPQGNNEEKEESLFRGGEAALKKVLGNGGGEKTYFPSPRGGSGQNRIKAAARPIEGGKVVSTGEGKKKIRSCPYEGKETVACQTKQKSRVTKGRK